MRELFLLLSSASTRQLCCWVTARYESTRRFVRPVPEVAIPEGAADRLAGSLRIQTISSEDPVAFDAGTFAALHEYLQTSFPRVHEQLARRDQAGIRDRFRTEPVQGDGVESRLSRGELGEGEGGHVCPGQARSTHQGNHCGVRVGRPRLSLLTAGTHFCGAEAGPG